MKPTMINAGFREIRLGYNNDKAPNELETKLLMEYPKLHYEYARLAAALEVFEKKIPDYSSRISAARTAFEPLEKECLVLEYFFSKQGETPPDGITVPENMNSAYTNAVTQRAQEFEPLMQRLYDWNENEHPVFKKWFEEWEDFNDRLDAFQEDVSAMYSKWKEGTVNIADFDEDAEKFYGFVESLWEKYRSISKVYNPHILWYNDFSKRVTWAYEQVNMVGDKIEEIMKKQPWHKDNVSLN